MQGFNNALRLVVLLLITVWCCHASPAQQGSSPESPGPAAQNTREERCEVTIRAMSATSGDPIKGAQVALVSTSPNTTGHNGETDTSGSFRFHDVVPAHYHVLIKKNGFVSAKFDRAGCDPTQGSNQAATNSFSGMVVHMILLSVISGHVMDADGEAVADAVVQAKQYCDSPQALCARATARTDDLGAFRLYGLQPGSYYVSATPPEVSWGNSEAIAGDTAIEEYVATLYPSTTDLKGAIAVSVPPGQQAAGIDIRLAKNPDDDARAIVPVANSNSLSSETPMDQGQGSNTGSSARKSTISGLVINQLTSEPVRHAKIALESTRNGARVPQVTQSDLLGNFLFRGIDPGVYAVVIERTGFIQTPHLSGAPVVAGRFVSVKTNQNLRDVLVHVVPLSVITGRVFDEDGTPVAGFNVQAMRYSYGNGRKLLQIAASAMTNDLGEYRLYGLSAGNYYVVASDSQHKEAKVEGSSSGQRASAYALTYYPGATDPTGATAIKVGQGGLIGGIDISAMASELVTVRGKITSTSGERVPDTVISLASASFGSGGASENTTTSVKDAQGHFEMRAVQPGSYDISALLTTKSGQYAGVQPLEVRNSDVNNVELTIDRAIDVSGKVHLEGEKPLNLKSLRILFEPVDLMPSASVTADVSPTGEFSVPWVLPDEYTIEVFGLPDNFYVKRIQLGIEDVRERRVNFRNAVGSLDVVVSSSAAVVSGTVADGKQQLVSGLNVVLVPGPEHRAEHDLYKNSITNERGEFTIQGVAPGDYEIFAIEGVNASSYFDADFLASVEEYGKVVTVENNPFNRVELSVTPSPAMP